MVKAKTEPLIFADAYTEFKERVMAKATGTWIEPVAPSGLAKLSHIKLYYTKASENSDKEYHVKIVPGASGYTGRYDVLYANGRRGKLGEFKPKQKECELSTAKLIFDKLVQEKKKEGYTTNVSGVPFSK